ncbi:MAG: metallophosphoesterase [Armatimonadota bacterium]
MLTTVLLWLLLLSAVCFIYYSHFVEPRRLRVSSVTVSIPRLPEALEGLRIAHLSDLHIKSPAHPFPLRMARQAVELALAQQPDLVCLTGDLGQASRFITLAAEILRPLAVAPMFAVMGNHDHDRMLDSEYVGPPAERVNTSQWRDIAAEAGLQLLLNEHHPLALRGQPVVICGTGDSSCGYDDLPHALHDDPQGALHLLLSHSPDIMDEAQADWADLVLCGHTHGGQAKLPWIGTLWAPVWRDRRRSEGLFRVGDALCYVSRGVHAGIRTRFLCPPELTVLTLTAGPGDRVRELPRLSAPRSKPTNTQ